MEGVLVMHCLHFQFCVFCLWLVALSSALDQSSNTRAMSARLFSHLQCLIVSTWSSIRFTRNEMSFRAVLLDVLPLLPRWGLSRIFSACTILKVKNRSNHHLHILLHFVSSVKFALKLLISGRTTQRTWCLTCPKDNHLRASWKNVLVLYWQNLGSSTLIIQDITK